MTEKPVRKLPRSFIIIVFGPLAGALPVFAWILIATIVDPPSQLLPILFMSFVVIFAFGWVAGLLPAILAASLWKFAAPRLSGWRRVAGALAIGAVSAMVAGWPLFLFYLPDSRVNAPGTVILGVLGALALAITALPGGKTT